MKIREMSIIDTLVVSEIEEDSFTTCAWPLVHFQDQLLASDMKSWIIETVSDFPIIIGYGVQKMFDDYSYISKICIQKPWRGCGIGRLMMEHMIDYAKLNKKQSVTLEVSWTNSVAKSLYESCGFQYGDLCENYYGLDDHGFGMKLQI